MDNETTRTKFDKLVGRIGDEYYFAEDVFEHSDNFRGATGRVLRPVSKSEYDERTSVDYMRDNLEESWKMAVESGSTTDGLDDWIEFVMATDGVDETAFDTSGWYSHDWDVLRKLGLSEEDYPVFEWTSCGRIFSHDLKFDEIYDQTLLDTLLTYEAK